MFVLIFIYVIYSDWRIENSRICGAIIVGDSIKTTHGE